MSGWTVLVTSAAEAAAGDVDETEQEKAGRRDGPHQEGYDGHRAGLHPVQPLLLQARLLLHPRAGRLCPDQYCRLSRLAQLVVCPGQALSCRRGQSPHLTPTQ